MRRPTIILLLGGSIIAVPSWLGARARHATTVRTVELISIGASTDGSQLADNQDHAQSLLQINDLNRREVEFRMAREFASLPSTGPVSGLPAQSDPPVVQRVAWTSSIAVPAWLRLPPAPPATITFVPGCGPAAYRPTGFLPIKAEVRRASYYGMMSSAACEHGIPVGLFDAMILRESAYDPAALSSKNAFGFAQLMPGTAISLGVNRYDPFQNLRGGARYLRQQLDRFGRVELALAAYNAGPGRIRNSSVPSISETQTYVANIIANWQRLTLPYAAASLD